MGSRRIALAVACILASLGAAIACGSFEEGQSTPADDAGPDGPTLDGQSSDGSSADGQPPADAGADVFVEPTCKVKPDSGCENNGCPNRCPPNVGPLLNDTLMALAQPLLRGWLQSGRCLPLRQNLERRDRPIDEIASR